MDKNEFHQATIEYMKQTDLAYRKSKGQYFTPKSIREKLLNKLPSKKKHLKILDPACGTGEFLISASQYFNSPQLYGWDIEEKLIQIAKQLVPEGEFKITDALKENINRKFDFVIGNPPYFEFKPEKIIKNKFREVINGRVNIFNLFIKLGLDLLKPNGYLAYVVPPSMNNGAYFSKLRKYIVKHANIEYLSILNNSQLFHKALQSTMLIILKKSENKGNYIFEKNGLMIFTEKPEYLEKAFKGKKTLRDLGFQVKTGRLTWNQNKEVLSHDPKGNIPLIWAKNITDKGLKILNHKKPQYVAINNYDIGPAIVVNRITGTVGETRLRAALLSPGMKFIAENHVNVIYPPSKNRQLKIGETEKDCEQITLKRVLNQLMSPEKLKVIQYITGNTQISKTELENFFPIEIS